MIGGLHFQWVFTIENLQFACEWLDEMEGIFCVEKFIKVFLIENRRHPIVNALDLFRGVCGQHSKPVADFGIGILFPQAGHEKTAPGFGLKSVSLFGTGRAGPFVKGGDWNDAALFDGPGVIPHSAVQFVGPRVVDCRVEWSVKPPTHRGRLEFVLI